MPRALIFNVYIPSEKNLSNKYMTLTFDLLLITFQNLHWRFACALGAFVFRKHILFQSIKKTSNSNSIRVSNSLDSG